MVVDATTARTYSATMKVIVDTREQQPWSFEGQPGITTIRRKLDAGDYSVEGLENRVAIERKSLNDWVNTVMRSRTRFYKELDRLRGYDFRCVIIEASVESIWNEDYRSRVPWRAVMGFIAEVTVAQSVPVYMSGSRPEAQLHAAALLWMAQKKISARNVQTEETVDAETV